MLALKNKTVFITGASSGIGKACAEQFASLGANLIITARRIDRINALAEKLQSEYSIKVLPIALDVRDNEKVKSVIENLPTDFRSIDVLVNNAGLALASDAVQAGKTDDWDQMIDTNLKGLLYVTRAILPGMIERKAGHLINIGSISGHELYPAGNVYCATKHAVKALTKGFMIDLLNTPVRVSEVDPGMVNTEFSEVRWDDKDKADKFYQDFTPLAAEDIADAVVYCATRPLHVNVAEMIVMPTDQASANHVRRGG